MRVIVSMVPAAIAASARACTLASRPSSISISSSPTAAAAPAMPHTRIGTLPSSDNSQTGIPQSFPGSVGLATRIATPSAPSSTPSPLA